MGKIEVRDAPGGGPLSRVFLSAALFLLAAALIMVAAVNRYQYFSVVGPSWSTMAGAETDFRRIDRWTGTPHVWLCQDVDTSQVASVPPPPAEPPEVGAPAETLDVALRNGGYLIALKAWRARHPNVNPQTMRVTRSHCTWEVAR
jgi:hypothetical protein